MYEILKGFTFVSSNTDIIFFDTFLTVDLSILLFAIYMPLLNIFEIFIIL